MTGTAPDTVISIIGPGMRVVGDCETEGTVRIEGRVEGSVRAGKAVVVGKEGIVDGDIFTQDAVISGTGQGTLTAESRLELQASCHIEGEIRARRMQLEEGAMLNGTVKMCADNQSECVIPPQGAASYLEAAGDRRRQDEQGCYHPGASLTHPRTAHPGRIREREPRHRHRWLTLTACVRLARVPMPLLPTLVANFSTSVGALTCARFHGLSTDSSPRLSTLGSHRAPERVPTSASAHAHPGSRCQF